MALSLSPSLSVPPISPPLPQSLSHSHSHSHSPRAIISCSLPLGFDFRRCAPPLSTFVGNRLPIGFAPASCSRPFLARQPTVATVLLSLPTAKPERPSPDKLPKWSARAIKSFAMAELEARKLKYPNTGTEALIMGILVEGTSLAAKFLRNNGITLFRIREETVELLGKSDMYFFSPEHPPLTEQAQRALDWAVDEKFKSGKDGEITTAHLLLGIWSEKESAGHRILASLGFNDEKAKELAESTDDDIVLSYK